MGAPAGTHKVNTPTDTLTAWPDLDSPSLALALLGDFFSQLFITFSVFYCRGPPGRVWSAEARSQE